MRDMDEPCKHDRRLYHGRCLFLHIPTITEDEQLDRFRRGLHPHLKAMVDIQSPTTFDQAVKIAVAHDTACRDAGLSTAVPMQLGLMKQVKQQPHRAQRETRDTSSTSAPQQTQADKPRLQRLTPEEKACKDLKSSQSAASTGETTAITPPPPRLRITKLAANSNSGSHADLLVFTGSYKGKSARVLIDGGATGSFIDSTFCTKYGIQTAQKVSPDYISLADGHQQQSNAMVPNARFRLGTYKGEQTLHVTHLHDFDIILGKPWLAEINPCIDWKANIMRFRHAGRQHTLRPPVKQPGTTNTSGSPLLISSAQLRTAISNNCPVFLVSITPADSNAETCHQVLDCSPIVQEYADVFPSDLPHGLPPERSVDHRIELQQAKPPPARPIYNVSSGELAELKQQIGELLDKGFIRPSTSPYASGVLLVRKKDGSFRMCIDYRPLTALTRADGHDKQGVVAWGQAQQSAFDALKQALVSAPILIAPDPSQPYTLRCDASSVGIGAVLSQGTGSAERVVAYHSRKLLPAERNYPTHEQELLSLVEALKVWRHYLLGASFNLLTDNWATKHIQTQPRLDCRRQARWMEVLQEYDCIIDHIPGKQNIVADALSRRSDYQLLSVGRRAQRNPAQVTETTISVDQSRLRNIRDAAATDPQYQRHLTAALKGRARQFTVQDNLLYHTGRGTPLLYIPAGPLRTDLLCEAHDVPTAGHLGRDKTYLRLSRLVYWPRMAAAVHDYIRTCTHCQRNKSSTTKPFGLLQPLPVPQHRWEQVSMDLITQLPVTSAGHDAIVVFVDKLTKMIHTVPTTTTVSAPELAQLFFDSVFKYHGLPKVIISDRDPRFTSNFWQQLYAKTGTHLNISTANHPQTDGQTERANRTIEDMLRNYVSPHHTDWDNHLTAVEFAYNASIQASTGYSPFMLNSGQEPHTPLSLAVSSAAQARVTPATNESAPAFLQRMATNIAAATQHLIKAQERHVKYANAHRQDHKFSTGDMVYLCDSFFTHIRPATQAAGAARKFTPRQHGPFKVLEVVTPVALRLQLPAEWQSVHPVVHVSHVKLHHDGSARFPTRNPAPPPEPDIIDGEEHYHVEAFRNHRFQRGKLQLQVKWLGHPEHDNSWVPLAQLQEDLTQNVLKKLLRAYAFRTKQPKGWMQPAVPLGAASYAATSEAAFGGAAAAMMADSLPWRPQGLNLLGRVQTCPQERSPNSSRLYPSKTICVMPQGEGGGGLPDLGVTSTAMLAKMPAQFWSPRVRPWQPLTHSLLADPSHGLSTWIINDPTAPPSRGTSPRLQAHVAALAELKLFRAVPPASQSFFSVLAEALWYNAQVRLNPAAREAAAERGWTHVRHVREALHSPQLEGEARWAADLVRACLPEPLQGMVDRLQPPQPEWEYLRVGPGVGFVLRRTPMLQPSHWVGPNGHLYPLDPTGQAARGALWSEEGAAWEPAAVDRLNKPSYRLTPEERATHLCPLPAQRHVEQEQAQGQEQGEAKGVGRGGGRARGRGGGRGRGRGGGEGLRGTGGGGNGQAADPAEEGPGTWPKEEWLLGPWAHRQLDPHVWGMGITTLLDLSVKHARVRLHQLQRVSADPSYLPGGGLWPALWGVRPPRAAGDPEVTTVADGALRELEHKWEASAQQVAGQGAAEEREERLHEEVQGSQPPRWLNTSAKAAVARAHLVRQLVRVEREGEAEVQAAQHLGEASARAGVGAREQGAQQSLLASAVLDQYYGDRSSFYFYHCDQPAHTPTPISSLQLPSQPGQLADLTTLAGVKAACRAFQQHYSAAEPTGVYAAKPMDTAARVTLLGSLTSHLTPTQARAAEGPPKQYGSPMLSEEELGRALHGCAHSKAPGLDGLPLEVYDRLWVELGRPLRATLQEALADTVDPAPLAEFQTGIITLVPKAGKLRDQVAGYRPITLLDCDVRLVARAVEDRLQLPLDLLVSPSQSAFILGRDISDSVQFHLGLLEYLQHRGSPAWLLLLDLAGAYDNVSWGLLQDTMEAMGFCREGHVRWAQLLHRGATSQVLVNGHLTDSFPLASGLLQGSGASPLYWCIVLQPLVSYLSSLQLAGRISTPIIPSSPLAMQRAALTPALPSKEYADDLTIVVLDRVRDGKVVVDALGLFRAAALLQFRGGQGQVGEQGLGGGPGEGGGQGQQQGGREQGGEQEPEVVIPAVRVGVPVRHLRVPLGAASYAATSEAAFGGAAAAMMAASLPWRPQSLNLLGRVQVAQQCLASKSIYQMAFVQPSAALAQAMALAVNRFVAASDLPQERSPNSSRLYPSKAICVMPRGEGGVGLPDLGVTSTAMLAKMLAQLWSPRVRPWQPLTHSLLADPSHGLSTWVITDPTAPPSRGISSRLQAHVAALAELKLFRAVPPASQSFFSVLAEPLWYNAQVRMNPAAREAAAEQGWTHVRHEEWLLGPWAHLQLDPQVWGMGTTTLLDFSVKHARVRLHQLQRVSADPLYPPSGGLWPALWGVRPPRAAGEPEVAAVADVALRELELKWEASAQQVAGQGAAGEREQQGRDVEERLPEEVQGSQPPCWLDTSARPHQRPSLQMRAAQQAERQLEAQQRRGGRQPVAQPAPRADTVDQLAVGVQAGQPCAQVWKELLDPTLRREHVIVAWRVLHASLMVGALWGHILKGTVAPGSSACRFCQPGPLETLTHAFMTCPAVVPAWEWVLDVYGRLTGTRPPSGDAMLLLSGRPTRGEGPPFQPPDSLLWLRLRVAYLGAVWRLRSSGAATALQPQQVARRVVEEVISTLATAVKRDWHRVGRDIRVGLCGALPSTWFKGKDPELYAAHFDQLWPEASGGWDHTEGNSKSRANKTGTK
ncbi:hypothetical protein QJQ45_029577 [Haematococcus lacustris]|nr:hypothetical protein QJQ45_029577 [Haematococcus lacustris]